MATNRIKKTLTAIPASIAQAANMLLEIGNKQREINRKKRELKDEIARMQEKSKKEIDVLTKERDNAFVALFAFAAPRKAELTATTRSIKTTTGTFGWRWTTPFVELAPGVTDNDVINAIKRKGLTQYIRITEEVDREAMLRDQPKIAGVSYQQRDEFFAKPKIAKIDGRAEELVKVGNTEPIDTLS